MASGITNKVHVARNGTVLGTYELSKIGDLLDNGQLLPTDHYFDAECQEWTLLTEVAAPEDPSPEFKQAEPRLERSGSSRRGRSGSKSRSKSKGGASGLAGWVACLFALGVAAGIWAWATSLSDQLQSADENVAKLTDQLDGLKRQNQMLNEITPPGRVRGIITYEPAPNQVAIMSGATVGLYKRADVEEALRKVRTQTGETIAGAESFDAAINLLKSNISTPIEITLTDSNGRLDMVVPTEGDYVLVGSAAKTAGANTERYFWLMGFHSANQPSGLVLMNESNAISTSNSQLEITDLPGFESGKN